MKSIILAAAIILAASTCFAGTVTLGWGASAGADKYNIYVDNVKAKTTTALTDSVTVTNGAHNFNVTAENAWGESAKSNTVSTPPLPGVPPNLTITVIVNVQVP